ncbi:hypothetical protein MKY95_21060 [Paenibacillus sp. FSL P4-0176]|uniref:hypothetical protein n=1 Tax=Paenibacillus sp. FSL P4-0176 TaxID=2921631 RepID=UPI0030CB91B5
MVIKRTVAPPPGIVDDRKMSWLKRNGVKPITLQVIREAMRTHEGAKQLGQERIVGSFQLYRKYNGDFMFYTHKYFEETPLHELKRKHRLNLYGFVFPTTIGRICLSIESLFERRVKRDGRSTKESDH